MRAVLGAGLIAVATLAPAGEVAIGAYGHGPDQLTLILTASLKGYASRSPEYQRGFSFYEMTVSSTASATIFSS